VPFYHFPPWLLPPIIRKLRVWRWSPEKPARASSAHPRRSCGLVRSARAPTWLMLRRPWPCSRLP
jgi:hypothetical protein